MKEIGTVIKTRFDEIGIIIEKTYLGDVLGDDDEHWDNELDLPWLICVGREGQFDICEYECKEVENQEEYADLRVFLPTKPEV